MPDVTGPPLAFVDDPARLDDVPPGATVVALTPFVELAARGLFEVVPADLFLGDAELEELGEETYRRVESLCDAIDADLRGNNVVEGMTARWRFQRLKTLFDSLLWQGVGAGRLAEARAPERVVLRVRSDSLAAAVIPSVLAASRVPVDLSEASGSPPPPLRSGPTVREKAASAALRVRGALPRRGAPRVLCLDERYSLPAISSELRRRGADVRLWLPPPRKPRRLRLREAESLASLFRVAGVDLWPAAGPRLRTVVEHELSEAEAALHAAAVAIRRDRPDVLLGSVFASPAAKAAATAARAAGVPSVVSRHGDLGLQQLPVIRFNDLDVVDWALCWGEWEQRFVDSYALRPVQTSVVGTPMIEEAVASMPSRSESRRRFGFGDDELVVLLAVSALEGDDWFAGGRAPLDLSHVRHQIALAEQMLALDDVRVAIKEHPQWPSGGPLTAWAKATGAPVTFVRAASYADVANLADAAVLDFPGTTLVQALHGSSRLYVVDHPSTAWEPAVLEHFASYGIRLVGRDQLAATLRADRDAGVLSTAFSLPQAAREPLAASGPGTAAERAADAVLRIAAGESPLGSGGLG